MKFLSFALLISLIAAIGAARADVMGQAWQGGKPARESVVWLDAPGAPHTPQRERVVLDQRNMTFLPHVLAVRLGTVVDFPNHDRVFHNVFSLRDGRRFDLGLYPVGAKKKVLFDKVGLSRIFCNIHPNMSAYVMTVDTPYFGVSDRQGEFVIQGAPAGTCTYHAWRPGGSFLNGTQSVGPGHPLEIRWP